jgi:hypothetical protein
MAEIEYYPFLLGDKAFCVWDLDIAASNRMFLSGVDPGYFEYLVTVNEPMLETERRQNAATALRAGYTHGLETLFALLGAMFHAPNAPAAWMLLYKNIELEKLTKEAHEEGKMKELVTKRHPHWHSLAEEVFANQWDDAGETTQRYGTLWSRMASEFIEPSHQQEYNSIKHGIRATMGGFSLSMGAEDIPGVPAPQAKMRLLGRSEFGSTFHGIEKFDKRNVQVTSRSINWSPIKYVIGLQLISMSIQSVISRLMLLNGADSSTATFYRPTDNEMWGAMWEYRPAISSFSMSNVLPLDAAHLLTKEQIEAEVEASKSAHVSS